MPTPLRSIACATLIAASLLAGCQSTGDGADTATAPTSEPSTSETSTADATEADRSGPTIPAGLWTRHLTPAQARADAKRFGLTPDAVEEIAGSFSEDLAYSFKVDDGVWAQYQALDGGESTVGDSGTFTYDADGNWDTVSNSTGCPGCVLVYRWSVQGDELTLNAVPGHDEDPVALFVTEGTYQQVS
jgi:hypothetical protein